jgi:hypothetical protein
MAGRSTRSLAIMGRRVFNSLLKLERTDRRLMRSRSALGHGGFVDPSRRPLKQLREAEPSSWPVLACSSGFVVTAMRAGWLAEAMMANNAFERTVKHGGPRLAAAWASRLAAQRDR